MELQLPVDAAEGVGNQINWDTLKRLWRRIVQVSDDASNTEISFGSTVFSYDGTSDIRFSIPHNLGKIPTGVILDCTSSQGIAYARLMSLDATNLDVSVLSNLDLAGAVFGSVAAGLTDTVTWIVF